MTAPVTQGAPGEPMPGSSSPPFISVAAHRLYHRLPQVYRTMDAQQRYQFKRWIAGAIPGLQDLDALVERLVGSRPVGPASPEPWDLPDDELERWRAARRDVNSALTDPDLAEPEWLPWIAQLLGATLDPQSGLQERRDTLRSATSGFRSGTRMAISDAARSCLTGSRYVQIQPGFKANGSAGTLWDITLRTRASETPDPSIVVPTVIRKGAKPAGIQLWHATFGTPWDRIEAGAPTWTDWESRSWDQLEELGANYAVPENLAPGPSFETSADIAKWATVAEGGGSAAGWALQSGTGVDGANCGRLTKVGSTGGIRLRSSVVVDARILQNRDYLQAFTIKPSVNLPLSLGVNWQNSSGTALSSTVMAMSTMVGGEWNRSNTTARHTSPANAARATLDLIIPGTVPAGTVLDVDAALFRLITASGG